MQTAVTSVNPVLPIKVLMHPINDMSMYMAPRLGWNFFHTSGFHHVIHVVILDNCWFLVYTVWFWPAFLVADFTMCIKDTIVYIVQDNNIHSKNLQDYPEW